MMDEPYLQRFGGIGRLYGTAGMQRLHGSHVTVIGVGGVGSWVVEALARSGVGRLTLIDMDDVCVTNINRQLPALTATVGRPKVEVLAMRVAEINPDCQVAAVPEFLSATNAERLLDGGCDFVVDAVDSTRVKALLIARCRERELPVIVSGSAGGRRDPAQVRLADLGHAGGDPMLQQVRRALRNDHGFAKSPEGKTMIWDIPCVYSAEKPVYPWADGSCSLEREGGTEAGLRLDCAAGFGAATFVTGAFGFALAAEVVRTLTREG